jgi:Fe-S cluster assembly protein SufD
MATAQDNTVRSWYRAQFAGFERSLNGGAAAPVHRLRQSAIAAFEGFPTTADEEWRFTNVAPIAKTEFTPVLPADAPRLTLEEIAPFLLPGVDAALLVFVDGHFSRELSSVSALPRALTVTSLADALRTRPEEVGPHLASLAQGGAFTSLGTAFLQDGAYVRCEEGGVLDRPVHCLFLASRRATPFVVTPRVLVVAGAGSRVSLVETHAALSGNVYLSSAVAEIILGDRAVVEHDTLQLASPASYHVGATHVRLGARSTFTSNAITFGGALVRNNVTAVFDGEHAECTLNGLSVAAGTQHVDNHTTIDHARPNCASHELYKSVLDGAARGVFNGKIFVRKDAQKTDARQTNKTLLLSDDATIDTKPQLEIFADDVKCTHGATVGQLDEEQVFYLRSRGIGDTEARDLLTFAFASDVINRVHVEPLRARLDAMLHTRLRQGRVTSEV